MENKFRKGLILGGLLAVAAAIGFAMTDEGQQLSEDLQKDLKSLAKTLKKNLHKLHDISKEKFDDLVASAVDEYVEKKELAVDAKDSLIKALKAKWHEMEAEYLSDQEKEEAKK